ncbi:MAG TPA: hypothetical protein VHE59_11110 [Mucilaginibacter sp.]|nr:hypothetical protein [Mucilaginibacter sp.]
MELILLKKIRTLRVCLILLAIANGFILFCAFDDHVKVKHFEEIDVERINIVGTNGKPVMVLSNKRLIPGPSMNGKTYPREYADGRQYFSGLIFFNEQGDEVGGLIYAGIPKDSGYYAMEHLSFDQWKQNQVVALQYIDNGKSKRAGLRIYDRPNVPLDQIFDRYVLKNSLQKNTPVYDSVMYEIKASQARGDNGMERMFLGSQDGEAQLQLRDKLGIIRGKLYVDANGQAKLEFLDAAGHVTKTFGE